jgi:hypothetical protein
MREVANTLMRKEIAVVDDELMPYSRTSKTTTCDPPPTGGSQVVPRVGQVEALVGQREVRDDGVR